LPQGKAVPYRDDAATRQQSHTGWSMSDPVTNIEIEDVLSSIRRLVSEDERPRARVTAGAAVSAHAPDAQEPLPADQAKATPGAPASAGRFVLTPALRVVDAVTEDADPAPDLTAARDATDPLAARGATDPLAARDATDRLAALDAPVPQTAPWDALAGAPLEAKVEDEDLGTIMAAAPAGDDAGAQPSSGRLSLLTTIAELEAAVTSQDDDWEPDGSEGVPVVDWASTRRDPHALLRNLGGLRTLPETATATADAPVPPAFRHVPPEDIAWAAQVLGQPVQDAVFAAGPLAGVADDPHDDRSDAAPAATPYGAPDADRAAGGLAQDLARSPEGAFSRDDEAPLAELGEGLIDEEMLRNLVIEIVRQELQGTLGERITRNVRKLVRREIYRVLSSQEFE